MEENPLHRAHAISAQANYLSKSPLTSIEDLNKALGLYTEASTLFENASKEQQGEDERKTLMLLVAQHKKLIRDIQRRINALERAAVPPPAPRSRVDNRTEDVRGGLPPLRRFTSEGSALKEPVGLASAASITTWPAGISTRLGVPPFAMRHTTLPHQSKATITPSISPTASLHNNEFSTPLHSSSSSDESFLNLGVVPDTLDPFSRFWGMLENMLDDISNPVAFATAPLSVEKVTEPVRRIKLSEGEEKVDTRKGKKRSSSPSESFYVVPSGPSRRRASPQPSPEQSITEPDVVKDVLGGKTPEELALENENLRISLDAIASHAETLERANRVLQIQHDEREKTMRSIAVGMRREAQKVKQGQDLLRSQLIASVSNSPRSARVNHGSGDTTSSPAGENDTPLKARIRELEEEVKSLKLENEKQKSQVEKYKDKFSLIKANARAKREARASGDGSSKGGLSGRRGSED